MAKSTLRKISDILLNKKTAKPKRTVQAKRMRIENFFKTRSDLAHMTEAEKAACDIFSLFYGKMDGSIQVKEDSLPLTNYANCLRTLSQRLAQDSMPSQLVAKLWADMAAITEYRTYSSECTKYNHYSYSPNYEHERILIFAGLMVVVQLTFQGKAAETVNAIRRVANSKANQEYFAPFDKCINTFRPDETSIELTAAVNYIKSTAKPYKALAVYEFLTNHFSKDEAVISYLRAACADVDMTEPEVGAHIENVHVQDGGAMNMFDNSTIQSNAGNMLSLSNNPKLIGNEDREL